MRRLFNILFVLIYCHGIVLVSSCSNSGEQDAPIKIGAIEWTGYDPLFLAEKIDLFKKNNVQAEIIRFTSTTEVIQALKDREIQGAGLTLDEVFSVVDSGFRGSVVLILDYSMGGDMIIGQKHIKHFKDLEGKTIGYEGTVVGEFLLERALHKNNLKRASINLVNIPKVDWLTTFAEKSVDALVCFNPTAIVLLDEYEGNLLFSSSEIPFEIIDVLFFSELFYDDNKVPITNIVTAWFDALGYIDADLDKAVEIMSTFSSIIKPEEYKQTLQDLKMPGLKTNTVVLDSESDKNIYKYSQVIVDFMISKGLLSSRINTTDLFKSEIVFGIKSHPEFQQGK